MARIDKWFMNHQITDYHDFAGAQDPTNRQAHIFYCVIPPEEAAALQADGLNVSFDEYGQYYKMKCRISYTYADPMTGAGSPSVQWIYEGADVNDPASYHQITERNIAGLDSMDIVSVSFGGHYYKYTRNGGGISVYAEQAIFVVRPNVMQMQHPGAYATQV